MGGALGKNAATILVTRALAGTWGSARKLFIRLVDSPLTVLQQLRTLVVE